MQTIASNMNGGDSDLLGSSEAAFFSTYKKQTENKIIQRPDALRERGKMVRARKYATGSLTGFNIYKGSRSKD